MKRVVGFIIGFILFALTVTGIHFFVSEHLVFDANSFGGWINQVKFSSNKAIMENANDDTLLVLGSSEFRHGRMMSSHPVNMFKDTKFNMNMIGAGYYQSLYHSIQLASVEKGMKKRKVALILSPQWFKPEGVLAPAFASRFSDSSYLALLENKDISPKTKKYIMKRTNLLLKEDQPTLERVKKYEKVILEKNATLAERQYVRFYRRFLEEKERISLLTYGKVSRIKRIDNNKVKSTEEPDWNSYSLLAEEEGRRSAKGNPFFVAQKVYKKQIEPYMESRKGSDKNHSYAVSKEYNDLECFLQVCSETDVKPMLVIMPVNGYWYDFTGFPQKEREAYYENVRDLARKYGAQVADFSKDERTPYFFIDKVHMGWKGWLKTNESLYNFAKSN
ncbi:MAG: D-alanyl-lipoteichoic acid biosynthesis protein DltD [Anaerovoracaceae bacterium]